MGPFSKTESPATGAQDASIDKLEEQRRLAFERLQQLRQFYQNPESAQLLTQMQSQASGASAPFSPGVVNAQLADNADASAGQVRNEQDMMSRAFANAGMSGSGLEASAMVNSRRRAAAASRARPRPITTPPELANFQARERAQQQLQTYLQQRQQAEAQAGLAEVDLRSRMHETGDAQNISGQATNPQANQQAAQAAQQAPAPQRGPNFGQYSTPLPQTVYDVQPFGLGGYRQVANQQATTANYQRQLENNMNTALMRQIMGG
jgi:hypothetical protein